MLKVTPSDKTQHDVRLFVDPSTYAPEVETYTYTSGHHTFGYRADFGPATPSAVAQLEAKPAAPAGYTTQTTGR